MKKIIPFFLLLFFLQSPSHGQDRRYVKGKKVYHDLDEALQHKDDVYNLHLFRPVKDAAKLELIGQMKHIQFLGLDGMALSSLPEAIWSLPDVRTLSLVNNKFHAIPEGAGRFNNLEYLVMYGNHITEVPGWIGGLGQLGTLILNNNEIDSVSPGIKRLSKLKSLSLGSNRLNHLPPGIGALRALEELGLEDNGLHRLPEGITKLAALEILHVNNNKLQSLPENLGDTKLKVLQAGNNALTRLPASVSRMNSLETLGLENNPLQNTIENFVFPPQLEYLKITGKTIRQVPPSLRNCKKLEHLEITGASITTAPRWLNELPRLYWLVLDDNRLREFPLLPGLQRLEVLRLRENLLDTFPGNLLLLPALKVFDIAGNPVRHIPAQLKKAAQLESFNIYNTGVPYEEYRSYRRQVKKSTHIVYNRPVYFEDEEKPCYIASIDTSEVFTHMETYPVFMKGWAARQQFMEKHLRRQDVNGLRDSVVLRFIVRRGGGISNIRVLHAAQAKTTDEAVRLLRLSCPYWRPANISGRQADCWQRLVLVFPGAGINVYD